MWKYEFSSELFFLKEGHLVPLVFTFLANDFLGLRFACDRHHLHQQPVAPLSDQGHHLLMAHLHYIYPVYLRETTQSEILHTINVLVPLLQIQEETHITTSTAPQDCEILHLLVSLLCSSPLPVCSSMR